MKVFSGITADDAWRQAAVELTREDGPARVEYSRAGNVRELLHAAFEIAEPRQRWVHSRQPPLNPAFALAEVVWIVNGRNDAGFLNFWNPSLPRFAGRDSTYHGAYGFRLRRHFGVDQLERAALALAANPDSRQVTLQIWDAKEDLPDAAGTPVTQDVPCNVFAALKVRGGKLDWLQVIRSNDIFLGTPHNFVQFTSLQEVLAGWIGVEVGQYVQISDSLHLYERDLESMGVEERFLPESTDRFVEPRGLSLLLFRELGELMDRLRSPVLSATQCIQEALAFEGPSAYRNIAIVVAADAVRRRGGVRTYGELIDRCDNPALVEMWRAWQLRCETRNGSRV